jgi:AmmeMemoRadiSam system protein B
MLVRPPAVAGTFYSADAVVLRSVVEGFLATGLGERRPVPKALVVPHAGYDYSGPIAGSGWACVRNLTTSVERVLLFGPAHRTWIDGCAVPGCAAFASPLGDMAVDTDLQERLVEELGVEVRPDVHAREHSLEVQIPFIQVALGPACRIVPVLVGGADEQAVAGLLDACWGGPETLVVVSTDLSHFLNHDAAQRIDRACCDAVLTLDTDAIADDQACGHQPLKGLLRTARQHKLSPRLLDLRNSGDTAGDRDRVVGYAAFAFS